MKRTRAVSTIAHDSLKDEQLVELAMAGDSGAFRTIMQHNNRRVYRVARGILGDDAEAEDVTQDTYMKAFQNLSQFRGDSSLATWLTRIAINEALGRKRKQQPLVELDHLDSIDEQGKARVLIFPGSGNSNPEAEAARAEIRRLLETALDELPEAFRVVFVMRDIEQMSTDETAEQLQLVPETVKTRLHRARRLLRQALQEKLGSALQDTYEFDGARCERMTKTVLARLGGMTPNAA